jgi:hypothetical protein
MRNVALGLGLLLVGTVSGYTFAHPTAKAPPASARDAKPSESLICSGGASSDLDVDFSTAVVSVGNGTQRARLRFALGNRGEGNSRAAYALEFVDDRGKSLAAPVRGTNVNIAPGAHVEAATFETPDGLADGFYMARATAVATGGSFDASEIRHLYFEVHGGQLNEIDIEDYLTRSDANKGESL